MFAFLTGFEPVDITSDNIGVVNDVLTMYNFSSGGWYAAEPIAYDPNRELFFEINETRFHFPSEHQINSQSYDAEFQIFGVELKDSIFWCQDQRAAISILLTVGDTENEFFTTWGGSDAFSLDFSKLMDKPIAMNSNMFGYKGSDTQPTCDIVCWYVFAEPFTITQTTLDAIKTQAGNTTPNTRDLQTLVDGSGNPIDIYQATHQGLFSTTPIPTPT